MNENKMLNKLYQNAKMGEQTMKELLKLTEEQPLRDLMEHQRKGYTQFSDQAQRELEKRREIPQDNGLMTKLSSNIGIKLNTLKSDEPSHLAEMIIQGSVMGITDATHELHKHADADESVKEFAKEIIRFEQDNIEHLKEFL